MTTDRFSYQGEKLIQARSSLMLPHEMGEAHSIKWAFEYCDRAFRNFDIERIDDDDAKTWVETIKGTMDTCGLQDTTGEGTWLQRAHALNTEQKRAFAEAVDALANWFSVRFWAGRDL